MTAFSPLQLGTLAGGALRKLQRRPVALYNLEGREDIAGADMTFDGVTFDAVVTVNHRRRATVTRSPVEEGADITEHTKAEPREIDLSDAIVSNLPMILTPPFVRLPGQGLTAWAQLEAWRTSGTVLTLRTLDEVYDKVVIEDLSKMEDAGKASALHATICLVEVRTVATRTQTAPKKDRAAGQVNKGTVPKKAAPAAVDDDSAALDGLQLLGVVPK